MENDELTKVIVHYQQGIEKYSQRNDEAKILHCISKLHRLPIKVQNLEQTGVGRTVNSLRKINGKIGDSAKLLVGKWKEMVIEEGDEQNNSKTEYVSNDEHKKNTSSSDYKESDKRSKTVESNSYASSSEKSVHENEKKSKHGYDREPTSSKRKSSHDSDEDVDQKIGKYHHRHKLSKQTHGDNLDEDDYSQMKNNKNESKHGSSKGKKDDGGKKHQKIIDSKKLSDDDLDQQSKKRRNEEKEERHSGKHKKEKKDYKSRKHESSHKNNRGSVENTKSVTETKEKHSKRHENKKIKPESVNDSFNDVGESIGENGIGSGSGTSFAEALGMLIPGTSKSKKKVALIQPLLTKKDVSDNNFKEQELLTEISKLEPLNINVSHLLPDITPNYRPLGNNLLNGQSRNKILNEDETLVQIMNTKISRTKVFSGNKCVFGKVPSLFDMCTRILQDNIDSLEYTGGVPFDILKPVIERATSEQLFVLEHHNPYLIEDTDELWKFHCQKEFRNKKREEMETWRDMYLRCLDEREAKLKALTANIKLSQDKSLPVRQTKLAYVDGIVKPDRSILRKQARFGTGIKDSKPLVTPSARLAKIVSNSTSGQVVVPNLNQRITSTSSSNLKPKKAPLMQKTLSFMKNRHFRR